MKAASGSRISKYSFNFAASQAKIKKILSILSEKEMASPEIIELIHLNKSHLHNYIKYLTITKQIYISSWKMTKFGQRTMSWPFYRAGSKKSKPKPPPLTKSEKCKRYRQNIKKDEEKLDVINAKRRAKRIKIKPDWMTQWITQNSLTGQ